jgi:NADH-quinone oxidoreductase subunit L
VTYLIGCLALCAIPPFAGFYSKDTIIEATKLTEIPGSAYAYFCVAMGAMVTAMYTFRSFFMTFHGQPRMDAHTQAHIHESPWVVWLPLVLLAIPSVIIGYILYMPMLFDVPSLLRNSVFVLPEHNVLAEIGKEVSSPLSAALHAPGSIIFWLTLAGVAIAWLCYIVMPTIPSILAHRFSWIYSLLVNKYGFDTFNQKVLVKGTKAMGSLFYRAGDQRLIDGVFVNGSGRVLRWFALKGRGIQSGYLYHYATFMILGLFVFLCWLLLG